MNNKSISINDVPIAIVVTSISGEIKDYNTEFKTILKLDNQTPGHLSDVLPNASILFFNTYVYPMLLKSGRLDEIYCKFKTSEGEQVPILMNIEHVSYANESCYSWALYRAEERQKFEAELIESRNKLSSNEKLIKQKNRELMTAEAKLKDEIRLRDRFFSIVAHDLKSPFNGLIGLSEMLLESAEDDNKESIIEYSTYILESSRSLYELTRNLLDWAVLQASHLKLEKTITNINNVISENLSVLTKLANKKSISIENDVSDTMILVDNNMASFIIRNILSNAIKFSPVSSKIHLSSKELNDTLIVYITDQGTGIEDAIIDDLFKIDIKTSTKGTLGEEGTGIGLPVCKQMAQLNDGDINCYNNASVGATFEITFPLANSLN